MSLGVHKALIADRAFSFEAAQALVALDPLVDAGIVVLYPPLSCYYESVAEDLFGTRRGFTPDEMSNAWPDLYVAEGLHYAKAFQASYTTRHGTPSPRV
jgi:hypothetical protein